MGPCGASLSLAHWGRAGCSSGQLREEAECGHGLGWAGPSGHRLGHVQHGSSSALLAHGYGQLGPGLVAGAPLLCPMGGVWGALESRARESPLLDLLMVSVSLRGDRNYLCAILNMKRWLGAGHGVSAEGKSVRLITGATTTVDKSGLLGEYPWSCRCLPCSSWDE